MKPTPKIHKLDQTINMFNEGCASFQRAMNAFEKKNTAEYETALRNAARDVPDALEWALKIYLENFPELEWADKQKLEKANFHQLITFMEKHAAPPLDKNTSIQLRGFRKMRNESTHQGAIPSANGVRDAIEEIRRIILTYLPVKESDLRMADGPEASGETVSGDTHPQAESPSVIFTHGHALLIGVGADLPITVQDATALHDLLIDPNRAAYPRMQVELLTETTATRQNILEAFDRLAKRANDSDEATVFVYFSGHGGRIEHPEKPDEYFLVPFGYEPSRRADTAISGLEFTHKIEALKARRLIVLLDCCHAGGVPALKEPGEVFVKAPAPPELLNVLETGSGRVVIASSHEDELSYTGTPYSVFTACLLEALAGQAAVNKDGFARILDVLIYLFHQVPPRAPGSQHPFVKKVLDLGDNFPLCYYAGGGKQVQGEAPPPEPAPVGTGLTAGQRRRLEKKYDDLQQEWNLRSEKVKRMRKDLAIQTSVAITFQLEQQLLDEEAQLARLGDELEEIERTLQIPAQALNSPLTASSIWLTQIEPAVKSPPIESHDRFITIGRAPKNTIQVHDQEVSWEHGQIILMQGEYYYCHLSNSNPSILRRQGEEYLLRPGKREEFPLRNHDRLTIGRTTFVIKFNLIAEDARYTTTAKKPEENQS